MPATRGATPRGGAGFSSKANKENPPYRKMVVVPAAHKKMINRRKSR